MESSHQKFIANPFRNLKLFTLDTAFRGNRAVDDLPLFESLRKSHFFLLLFVNNEKENGQCLHINRYFVKIKNKFEKAELCLE